MPTSFGKKKKDWPADAICTTATWPDEEFTAAMTYCINHDAWKHAEEGASGLAGRVVIT